MHSRTHTVRGMVGGVCQKFANETTLLGDLGANEEEVVLTWFHQCDGLSLGELKGSHPALAFYLRASLQMERLCAAIGDDEATRVLCMDEGIGQVDCAPACVCHFSLVSAAKFADSHCMQVQTKTNMNRFIK